MDDTNDELVSTRARIETDKPSSRPDTDTLSSSSYTPITASASSLSPSAVLPDALTASSKIHNRVDSVQVGFQKMC